MRGSHSKTSTAAPKKLVSQPLNSKTFPKIPRSENIITLRIFHIQKNYQPRFFRIVPRACSLNNDRGHTKIIARRFSSSSAAYRMNTYPVHLCFRTINSSLGNQKVQIAYPGSSPVKLFNSRNLICRLL